VQDSVEDVQALLTHFGIEKFVSIGWSGGGPHCLADTTLAQNAAAISIAGVGAFGASDLDFLAGMGEENHVEFGAAIKGEAEIEEWMKTYSGGTATVTGPEVIEALGGLIGDADKNSLNAEVAEELAAAFRHALVVSYYGWMDDDLAFVQPWGFDLAAVDKPVELWQGDDDFMVPHAHGKWIHSKISGSQLIFVPGEGHISLGENKRDEIISHALGYLK
jgi:pimeloyl-ACP methyl ester carboxylesterase